MRWAVGVPAPRSSRGDLMSSLRTNAATKRGSWPRCSTAWSAGVDPAFLSPRLELLESREAALATSVVGPARGSKAGFPPVVGGAPVYERGGETPRPRPAHARHTTEGRPP